MQVQFSGYEEGEDGTTLFLEAHKLKGSPASLRLQDVVYAIEGGQKVFLWWDDAQGTLILPLEGRGRLDFNPIGGIANPRNEGWTGHVSFSTQGKGHFFVGLEFVKLTS